MEHILFICLSGYLTLLNAAGLALMYADKKKAMRHMWRIPESTLIAVAALGGSLGSFAGMYLFHHKTKHPKFFLGIPALLVCHIALLIFLVK